MCARRIGNTFFVFMTASSSLSSSVSSKVDFNVALLRGAEVDLGVIDCAFCSVVVGELVEDWLEPPSSLPCRDLLSRRVY